MTLKATENVNALCALLVLLNIFLAQRQAELLSLQMPPHLVSCVLLAAVYSLKHKLVFVPSILSECFLEMCFKKASSV